MSALVKKVLIANRGEIAVRIARRAAKWASPRSPSSPSATARRCTSATPTKPTQSARARRARATCASIASSKPRARAGADAVHPGYGFLAENEEFAAAVRDAGLTFIGPTPEAMALMGSKTAARAAAARAGVPVVPGTDAALGDDVPDEEIARAADRIGYPLLVKAVAGGGGKGMRTVVDRAELERGRASRAVRSGHRVRRHRGLPRAAAFAAAARRSPAPRRIITAPCFRSWSASVRSSGGIRRSSRRRRRWR